MGVKSELFHQVKYYMNLRAVLERFILSLTFFLITHPSQTFPLCSCSNKTFKCLRKALLKKIKCIRHEVLVTHGKLW